MIHRAGRSASRWKMKLWHAKKSLPTSWFISWLWGRPRPRVPASLIDWKLNLRELKCHNRKVPGVNTFSCSTASDHWGNWKWSQLYDPTPSNAAGLFQRPQSSRFDRVLFQDVSSEGLNQDRKLGARQTRTTTCSPPVAFSLNAWKESRLGFWRRRPPSPDLWPQRTMRGHNPNGNQRSDWSTHPSGGIIFCLMIQ